MWLATVKPNGAAHLVPIWAVLVGDSLWMATAPGTQKVRNVLAHPRAALSLPDPQRVLVLEGTIGVASEAPPEVQEAFQGKYDWTFTIGEEWVLLRFVPEKVLSWTS